MIAVVFEVTPKPGCQAGYFDLAAETRPLFEQIDGFVSLERFASLDAPGKLLSVSLFRDDSALTDLRKLIRRQRALDVASSSLFADYRLRVASVIRDYGMTATAAVPEDSRVSHAG